MGLFALSPARTESLRRFRRNTWKAIALFSVLRLADASLGLGLLAPSTTHAGQTPEPALLQECQP